MNANAIVPSPPRIHSLVVICSVLKKKNPGKRKPPGVSFGVVYDEKPWSLSEAAAVRDEGGNMTSATASEEF